MGKWLALLEEKQAAPPQVGTVKTDTTPLLAVLAVAPRGGACEIHVAREPLSANVQNRMKWHQRGTVKTDETPLPPVSSVSDGRTYEQLIDAIKTACRLRGDTDANIAGLIAESAGLSMAHQLDMTEHFNEQAAIWRAATGAAR